MKAALKFQSNSASKRMMPIASLSSSLLLRSVMRKMLIRAVSAPRQSKSAALEVIPLYAISEVVINLLVVDDRSQNKRNKKYSHNSKSVVEMNYPKRIQKCGQSKGCVYNNLEKMENMSLLISEEVAPRS
jgi:hypothetical protein